MTILALAVLLAVVQAAPPIPRQAVDNHASKPEAHQTSTQSHKQAVSDPSSVPSNTEQKQNETNPASPSAQPKSISVSDLPTVTVYTDSWFKAYVIFTGLLVAVGSFGVCYAVGTLRVLKRQAVSMRRQTTHLRRSVIFARRSANAAKKSANAAKASADALINSARAWLIVEIDWDKKKWSDGKFHLLQGSGSSGDQTVFDAELICRNEGKSPAWIDEKRAVCVFVPIIPPTPRLDATSILQAGPEPIGIGQSIPHTTNFSWFAQTEGHAAEGKILLIFGVVKYRDPFGSYQTTFGYRILSSGPVRIEGYPEYNWNT